MKDTSLLDKTTIVTRIRNRNEIFADTLQNWLQFGVPEIVITDYRDDGCESAWDVVKGFNDPRVKVVETKYEYMFCPTFAWNLGISQVQTEYMLCLDVDDILSSDFFERNRLSEKEFISGWGIKSLTGGYFIKKEYHDAVNGFNENLLYMGYGDLDLYKRLKTAGLPHRIFAQDTVRHKNHPVRLKIENQVKRKGNIAVSNNAQCVWDLFNAINHRVASLLPWTPESIHIKWKLTELESNRYLAERDVTDG